MEHNDSYWFAGDAAGPNARSRFDEMALVDNFPRSASANGNADTVLLLTYTNVRHKVLIMNQQPGSKLLRAFTRTLSRRLRETSENLEGLLATTGGSSTRRGEGSAIAVAAGPMCGHGHEGPS